MSIESTLIEIINDIDFPITTQPRIVEAYDASEDEFLTPVITVREIDNSAETYSTVDGETLTSLDYQVEVYSQPLSYDGVPKSAIGAARSIGRAVQTALNLPGLTRSSSRVLPYSTEVGRFILRFSCVQDAHGYFYQR